MIDLIPAIDIIDGKLVRLSQGDYAAKTVYSQDPLDVAKGFEDIGLTHLHVVDLDGAKAHHIVNAKTLEAIASHTRLIIDFGGGIKSDADLETAFSCGARRVTAGSIAVQQPVLFLQWVERYGGDRIILGADIKDGRIASMGWTEESDARWETFLQSYTARGVERVISTDISRDGMMTGPSIELYKDMLSLFPGLHVTASGGVSCISDVARLEEAGIPAVIIGKAIYEGRITMRELEAYQLKQTSSATPC